MSASGSLHARIPTGLRGLLALALGAAGVVVACEPIRPSERPSPPPSLREARDFVQEAQAQVHVTGTVASDVVLGTHELALTVENRSRWTLTALRVEVGFDADGDASPREYVLRTRGGVGPGQTTTLSTRIDGDGDYGRPPAWRLVGALGHPPGS